MTKFEEISLIAKCVAADDRHAFGRLVDEYQESLRRFIFNLTGGDASLTDDIAQETFLKAYVSIRSFKGLARFKTWLYKIAYREFLATRKEMAAGIEAAADVADSNLNPERETESKHDVSVALNSLNETERTLVLLFYLEDQPIKKIASITDLPEGTIKVYLSRARTKMAKVLNAL
ncbi:MAG: RNA polymerase sigma factor [Paramuribaculum sp.]|nr:RNA polymerase sigma factor [Paramuribaculum sp.]